MSTTTRPHALPSSEHGEGRRALGDFLRSRRARLQPAEFGFTASRRRTAGLRREEAAQLANVSVTWFTWLEQGRGVRASTEALERIARALRLDRVEREHLFHLAQDRPPPSRHAPTTAVTPAVQRMLDGLVLSPALVKTARWDVVAWNRAAARALTDYGTVPPTERNALRLIFTDPRLRRSMPAWEEDAQRILSTFRADFARAGGDDPRFLDLIEELDRVSPEFHLWWPRQEVRGHGEGVKAVLHSTAGELSLEYTTYVVEGVPDLSLVVYTPVPGTGTAEKIAVLVA